MSVGIHRHFVTVDGRWGPRQVHYRRAGRGPLVLLLHQSPQSSREMVPLLETWREDFTLVAPDTPGYGHSDPLGGEVADLADFAAATLEFADAIGAARFGIYGFHTGASIGVLLAARHPERVSALAGNGLILLDEAERADVLAHYLLPVTPRWDGGHLAWLWARLREQAVFFPWHARSSATRMNFDVPPPERLQASLLEFLAAGEHYAAAYRGAFRYRVEADLPGLRVPTLITAAPRDPLAAHLVRIRNPSPLLEVTPAGDPADALARARAWLRRHPGAPCPAPPATRALPGLWSGISAVAGHPQLRWRHCGPERGQPLVLLHDAGGSASALDGPAATLAAAGYRISVPDLPGHGASDAPGGDTGTLLAQTIATLQATLEATGLGTARLLGSGGGGLIAAALRERLGQQRPAAMLDPPLWSVAGRHGFRRAGLPALTPLWHGGHLLECWHMVRDGRLFFPWFLRERSGMRAREPDLDEARIHAEVVDLLRAQGCWQALLDQLLREDWQPLLARPVAPRILFRADVAAPAAQDFAPVVPGGGATVCDDFSDTACWRALAGR